MSSAGATLELTPKTSASMSLVTGVEPSTSVPSDGLVGPPPSKRNDGSMRRPTCVSALVLSLS